ncbi:hypothetical protein [Parageobacillus galactosidasius]|uniref:Uncharacterized protein n=1 Tax=Parageobacillus galactosidasius TaxID=883812 RepID=A0A226QTL0_9BACL|nr:hypothetical protein [Parageobacillus galactosidasius]OXB94842.1 hypothetical protein B9L23_08245 [Parageobacillus galactosidasius]
MGDDQAFNFLDELIVEHKETPFEEEIITLEDQVRTSYLLVNTLLHLLIQKKIIQPHEVHNLLRELHQELRNRRGRWE